jgi:hypothetical protein
MGNGLDDRGSIPDNGDDGIFFLFDTASRPVLGLTHFHIEWEPGALTPEVQRARREADHSPPSNAAVKKRRSYTSTPRSYLHGVMFN